MIQIMTKNKNDDLDFFDQQYFANLDTKPDLDKNRQNLLEKDIKSEEIKAEIKDLNFIDNLMFNQQSNSLENSNLQSLFTLKASHTFSGKGSQQRVNSFSETMSILNQVIHQRRK